MFGNTQYNIHHCNGFKFIKISKGYSNANVLICLHGMFGKLSNFDPILEYIDNYTVYVPTIPIYELEIDKLSIKNLTQWLDTFYESEGITKSVLLGNSMGGHLALDYTLQYPQKVAALILTGSSGLQEKNFGSTCPRRNDRDYIKQQAQKTFYKDLVDEEMLDDIMEVITSPSKLRKMLVIARDTHEYQMEQYLSSIAQRVLLIWGNNDEVTPPEVAEKFQYLLPNAQLRWIAKCGHAPMMEHPKKFAILLNEFLIEQQNPKNISSYEENYSHF